MRRAQSGHQRRRALAGLVAGGVALSGCAAAPGAVPIAAPSPQSPSHSPTATPSTAPERDVPDPAGVGANELGAVPVLMYHQVIENPRDDYDRTPAEFRAEIQMLYDEGYRPVTAADFVAGRIDIPAGTHPVVLTFDDSTISQAQIGEDGEPEPDSALGMLEALGAEHPDFEPTATFYVNTNNPPFIDDAVLPWLVEHGYEVGAHTFSHASLRQLSDAGVQEEIGRNVADIEAALPGYEVTTFATTYGIDPVNVELNRAGTHDGVPYQFTGVVGVDSVCAPSPFAAAFDPYNVPRVGSGLAVADVALRKLREDPSTRYTSDGDPDRVSFPEALADDLALHWQDRAQPY